MNARALATLILLNAVLLAAVVVTALSPQPAEAQIGAARGQYVMITGEVAGRTNQDAIYVMHIQTGRVVGLFFNTANGTLEVIDGRDINADLQSVAGRR